MWRETRGYRRCFNRKDTRKIINFSYIFEVYVRFGMEGCKSEELVKVMAREGQLSRIKMVCRQEEEEE